MKPPTDLPKTFRDRISVDADGCWLWLGTESGYGYANFFVLGRGMQLGHRYAYEALVGPIPDGLVLDHLCRVRHCVNPDHLEPVTSAENTRRGAKGRLVTVCGRSRRPDLHRGGALVSPVDWFRPDWGGRVHIASNGSDVPDRHTSTEEEAERDH